MDSYFLPPVDKVRPPRGRWREFGIRRASQAHFIDFFRGKDVEIAGVTYNGGYWHGPLDATQITDITAAGYGDRIAEVASVLDLPGLDNDGNLVVA